MLFSDFLLDWNSGELERNLWLCTSACGTAGSVLFYYSLGWMYMENILVKYFQSEGIFQI